MTFACLVLCSVTSRRRFGPRAALVLAACHSLVQVAVEGPAGDKAGEEGAAAGGKGGAKGDKGGASGGTEVVGDPLEKAALEVG